MGGLASMQHMMKGAGVGTVLKRLLQAAAPAAGRTAAGVVTGAGLGAAEGQLLDVSDASTASLMAANALGGAVAAQPGVARRLLYPKQWSMTSPASKLHLAKGRLTPKLSPGRVLGTASVAGAVPTVAFYGDRSKRLADKLVQGIEADLLLKI